MTAKNADWTESPSSNTWTYKPNQGDRSLTRWTLLGLLLGIATGLFFGDFCKPLKMVGDAFIGLLQMTVFPYIAISLIANIGKLTPKQAKRLAKQGLYILGLLWGIGLVMLTLMPLSFPDWKTAAFFSKSKVENPPEVNYLNLFIPENPFFSFANGFVPAVVVFCVCVGVAMIRVKEKSSLIAQFDILAQALKRVNGMVVRLMPYGIFVLAAAAAGTLSTEDLDRLIAYLLCYTLSTLFLALWVLPVLIASVTPFRYTEVVSATRDAMITGLVTGKLIVTLPLLIDATHQLFERYSTTHQKVNAEINLLYPLAYPFPNLGKLMTALFIPFSAWFLGESIAPEKYLAFLGATLLNMFGNVIVAIDTLLNMLHLQSDMLQLFIISGVLGSRIGEMLGVMHLATFVILATCASSGLLQIRWKKIVLALVTTFILLFGIIEASRLVIGSSLKNAYSKNKVLEDMQLIQAVTETKVLDKATPNPMKLKEGESRLQRMRRRGWLRVGFDPDDLPFSYFNHRGELVGYDIDLAHRLAGDLGVKLELVPINREILKQQLEQDCVDLVMTAMPATIEHAEEYTLTQPYLNVTQSLVVRDYRVNEFQDFRDLERMRPLRIAHRDHLSRRFLNDIKPHLKFATFDKIHKYESFFEDNHRKYDALLIDAESGSAWTILYPQYKVVVYRDIKTGYPLVYVIAGPDPKFLSIINTWIRLHQASGEFDKVYNQWILGQLPGEAKPRWSVLRNVLHWVD